MIRHPFTVWISLSLLALALVGCSGLAGEPVIVASLPPPTQPAPQVVALPQSTPDLNNGAQVYAANCTRCHGATGKGDGEMVTSGKVTGVPDFTDPKLAQSSKPADWYEIVTNGRLDKLMPPWKDKLTDTQRWDVTMYVYTLANGGTNAQVAAAPTVATSSNQQPAVTEDTNSKSQPATTADANMANTTGTVGGKVTNLTSGGTVPTDISLSLYVVNSVNPQEPQQVLDTKIKADGTYQFENVPIGTNQHYVVMASYKNTVFTSDMVAGNPTHPQVDLPISIYEVTDNADNIKISEMVTMMQVNSTTNQLQVVQIVSFTNDSDRAYLKTADGTSLSTSVKLPKGAAFQDFSSGKYKLSADGTEVFDTEPVMPGNPHLMHLGYSLPYTGQMSIDQPITYALNGKVQVMVANKGLSISGDQFTALGASQLGSQTYQSFGGDFTRTAGDTLRYSLIGSLTTTSSTSIANSNIISPLAYIFIAIGLVAIGTAFGFFLRERTDQRVSSQSQINDLMKQIADLDVRHNEGKLNEAQYLKQRTALKTQLVTLMKSKSKSAAETSSN